MGGIASLFKNIGRVFDAKAQKTADQIEMENSTDFGKQDVSQMQNDLSKITDNIGTIKGEMAILKEKVKDYEAQIKKHDDDAIALDAAGKSELALKHTEAAEVIEKQLDSLRLALKTQETLLADQQKTKAEMSSHLQQAQADLVTLKAMNDAAQANENLSKVSSATGKSALAAFESRKEEAKKRLIKSQAIREEGSQNTSLESETEKALGRSGGNARLEKLKAAKTQA